MRISGYTDAIADRICEEVTNGRTLIAVCNEIDVPYATVAKWQRNNLNGFASNLIDARRAAAALLQDQIIDIANACPLQMAAVQRATMQIKARQWLIEKLHPEKFAIPVNTIEDDNVVRPQDFLKLWQTKNPPKAISN